MLLSEIIKTSDVEPPAQDIEITALSLDSRQVKPGCLFFAVKGAKSDGHGFIETAVKNGAVAVAGTENMESGPVPYLKTENIYSLMAVCARNFYGDPSAGLSVTGITGTNGKTTTSYFLESIFNAADYKPAVIGTINYRINGSVVSKALNTTPEILEMSRIMARALRGKSRAAVMEVSSHALFFGRTEGVQFDSAVFLNLTQDHLDHHKTMDAYFAEKRKLFKALGVSPKKNKTAVLNADSPYSGIIADELDRSVRTVWFGLDNAKGFYARSIRQSLSGAEFDAVSPDGAAWPVRLKLWGKHNVSNALAAFACAVSSGVEPETGARGLSELQAVPGRMQGIECGQDFYVFVDFAHTPDGLEKALSSVGELRTGRIITVFGCGGDRDRAKRAPMGRTVCSKSDWAFVTLDNPRTENPDQILSDIRQGLVSASFSNFEVIPDRRAAIAAALAAAKKGDIVLIAGKGHEQGQIFAGKTVPFCDAQTARDELAKLISRGKNGF